MYHKQSPFDEVIGAPKFSKGIPKKAGEEFVDYINYLATSPQLNPGEVSSHIQQFLALPKVKTEHKKSIYYALHDLYLPDDFWNDMMPEFQQELRNKDSYYTDAILYAISAAPFSIIISKFNNLLFLNDFISSQDLDVQYAALSTLYTFRNHITITDKLVQSIFDKITTAATGKERIHVLLICLNFLIFFVDIDFPNIHTMLQAHREDLLNLIIVHGHLLNINLLHFIIKCTNPSSQVILSFIDHVGLPAAAYLFIALINSPDQDTLAAIPSSSYGPRIIDVITHPFSEGIRDELISVALQISKISKDDKLFNKITHIIFNTCRINAFDVISLFADVSLSFQKLQSTLELASQAKDRINIFYQLTSVSAMMVQDNDAIDISNELLKLLSAQNPSSKQWRLAASCAGAYIVNRFMHKKEESIFQQFFDVTSQITAPDIRALLLLLLSPYAPAHLRSVMVQRLKSLLFPENSNNVESPAKFERGPDTSLPLLLKLMIVRSLRIFAKEEDLNDVKEQLNTSIYKYIKPEPAYVSSNFASNYISTNMLSIPTKPQIPLSPFFCCDVEMIGQLAAAMSPSTKSFTGVVRPFVTVSPEYHAIKVEIQTIVFPKHRSMQVDLRISNKGVVPAQNLVVDLSVPLTLTPPQIDPWKISSIKDDQKVSRRISFTVNQLMNPYAALVILDENGNVVFDSKLCLPLIDMFDKAVCDRELLNAMWWKLKYEKKDVKIDDGIWVCSEGCIVVMDHVARATQENFLEMLNSAQITQAVIE